eukprot:293987_1
MHATKELVDDIEKPFVTQQFDHENETVCESLKNPALWKLVVYGSTIAFAFQFPDIVMSEVGAKYFHEDKGDSCTSGNAKYAYYSGIFASIGGLLAFLLEGYLGRLSDVYGRKKIMYITWFCMFATYCTLTLSSNVWISLALSPLTTLCGAMGGTPSVLQAALADSVKSKKNRTIVFALLFGMAGLIVLIAAILCPILTKQYGINIAFWIFSIVMLIDLLWLIFVVDETLPVHKRVTEKIKYENPFKIFVEIKNNKILLWFSVVVLVTAIPETGLNDILTNYCNEQLGLCSDNNGSNSTTTKDAIFTGTIGAVLLISQLFMMPIFTKYLNDIGLFIIGLLTLQIMMFMAGLLYFIPNIIVAISIFASFGASYILIPIVDGSLSKRLNDKDQGIGIGVVHGIKGVTTGFAPYLFGGLYNMFHNDQWYVVTPFIVGSVISLCGFFIVLGPLRNVINLYDEKQLKKGKVPLMVAFDQEEQTVN